MYQTKIFVLLLIILAGILPKLCFADSKSIYLISGLKWNDFRDHSESNTRSDLSIGVGFDLSVEKTSRVEFLKTDLQANSPDNQFYRITTNDLNYVSVHNKTNFNVFSTVGVSNLKLGLERRNLLNFGVGISRRLSDKLRWRA